MLLSLFVCCAALIGFIRVAVMKKHDCCSQVYLCNICVTHIADSISHFLATCREMFTLKAMHSCDSLLYWLSYHNYIYTAELLFLLCCFAQLHFFVTPKLISMY